MKIVTLLKNPNVVFSILFLFAAILYLYRINFSDVWLDEAFTKAVVRHSFGQMWNLIRNDFHPPLYFYALKLFTLLFGLSTFTVRLFSTLGALSAMLLGFATGKRVFGRQGALYFSFLLLTLPMMATYAHEARMYTWVAFSVTGLFLYGYLFMTTSNRKYLYLMELFSLLAAYTHYYGLVAAAGANLFVFVRLLQSKNRARASHLAGMGVAGILYLPWLSVLLMQSHKVSINYWIPDVSWQTVSECFIGPFTRKFFTITRSSYVMMVIIYGIALFLIYGLLIRRNGNHRWKLLLSFSLTIFFFTFFFVVLFSVISRSILFPRYFMAVVTMLLVPAVIFFVTDPYKWLNGVLLAILLVCGIYISLGSSRFSYGPFRASMVYLSTEHPDIHKVVHFFEVTPGPLIEYTTRSMPFTHYWLRTDTSTVITNMAVFDHLQTERSLHQFLKRGEVFCLVCPPYLPFNTGVLKAILRQTELITIDTVKDHKVSDGDRLYLYVLKYK